jgi:transcriptional regulator with XRE-family HTH domain
LKQIGVELVNTVTAKRDLLDNCRNSEYREALVFENVYTGVCSQMRVLREQRELSQAEFGRKAKMAQERISILEDPNAETKPTLKTLLRVASAFDVGLDVRFVPFETILDRSVNTESSALQVPSFDEELPELEKHLEAEEVLQQWQQINPGKGHEPEKVMSATEKNFREAMKARGKEPAAAELELVRQLDAGRASAGPQYYTLNMKPGNWSTLQPIHEEPRSSNVIIINEHKKPPRQEEIIQQPEGEYRIWRSQANGR